MNTAENHLYDTLKLYVPSVGSVKFRTPPKGYTA